jgi:methionyl-tRNA synthetase
MKKILITSALPYVNNVPHLGNIIGCVLSADVFSRFCKSKGLNSRFVCGTDEHGTTTEAKALEEGLTPKEVCDKYYKIHKDIYDWFNIGFDVFGRTSSETHKKITQEIFLKLYDNGFIAEDFLEELYCNSCQKSLADRFVEGVCPFCNYEGARGDQCDKCGKLLNATELLNPKCKVCGNAPAKKNTKHLFLDLEKLQPELEAWINKSSKSGFWTDNSLMYTKTWLNEGLKKRCISRQLKWGIPIPLKGFESMVFYVWFDAPIGYISITANKFDDWKDWWKNPDHVELYQFMGKDNVPFHTILFPATMLASRDKYTMLHHIDTTEYLNYEDGKFSKSRGTGVFGDDAISSGIPSDVFRYYLLINRPERADTVFSWDDFQEKLNSELLSNLGNLVNRTLVFLNRYFDSKILSEELDESEKVFWEKIKSSEEKIASHLSNVKIKDALKESMALSDLGNKFFQDSEPWKSIKENPKKAASTLYVLANLVKDIGIIFEPFIPASSNNIFKQLNIEKKKCDDLGKLSLKKGHQVLKAEVLFTKLLDEDKEKLKEKFSGEKNSSKKILEKKEGFALLNLRVALIKEAKAHPQADKLVILQLDLGELGIRQIVAGIKPYYPLEELIGKKIVVVSNLKPAKLRGEESRGMLLACSDEKSVGVLTVNKSKAGSQVYIDGIKPNDSEITIDDFANVKLEGKRKKAFFENNVLKTSEEEIIVDKGIEGKIR